MKFRFDTLKKLKRIGAYEDVFDGGSDNGDRSDGFPKVLERLDPRYEELITPLLQLAPTDESKNNILGFTFEYYDVKMDEEKSSLEAQIVEVIYTLHQNKEFELKAKTHEEIISIQNISRMINQGMEERDKIKKQLYRNNFKDTWIQESSK